MGILNSKETTHPPLSFEIPFTESENSGPIHRNANSIATSVGLSKDETDAYPNVYTGFENFHASVLKFPEKPYLGFRRCLSNLNEVADEYEWLSYRRVFEYVRNLGSGLVKKSLCPPHLNDVELNGRGVIGIYSKNRPEWVMTELAAYSMSIVPVPMYDTLTSDGVAYVVNQVGIETLVTSVDKLEELLNDLGEVPSLRSLIVMDMNRECNFDELLSRAKRADRFEVFLFSELLDISSNELVPVKPPNPEDICTFCYTSGTTGDPKGALISHQNIIANVYSIRQSVPLGSDSDVHLSYLPLPHMFERVVQLVVTSFGGSIGFYQGDSLKIVEDLTVLRPTIFPSVPRLLTRVQDKILSGVASSETSALKRMLFNRALSDKLEGLDSGYLEHGLWDKLVFGPLKYKLGLNNLRYIITGSAPIPKATLSFLRAILGVPVMEGYGLTECTVCCSIQPYDDYSVGNVGAPVSCNGVRLVDVPEMSYFSTDSEHNSESCRGRGEICIKGINVFQGYYKMPDKTSAAIDADGWLHTGDIGLWTLDGKLKIIDRKNNIFKLAQSEYVAPESVENAVTRSPFVLQSFVYGDTLRNDLVAICVLDVDSIMASDLVKSDEFRGKDINELVMTKKFIEIVENDIGDVCRKIGLRTFEIPKAFALETTPWTANDFLTPTFKLKRAVIKKEKQTVLDSLYNRGTASKL